MLNDRTELLLKSLIQRYISDGQPVGSRTLAKEAGLDISPATVRNVMSDLEEMGFIKSPHTSAGRIPTQQGYRFFVDSLLNIRNLTPSVLDEIEGRLRSPDDPQQLLATASDLLSRITSFAGVVLVPRYGQTGFKQVEFLQLSKTRVLTILVTDNGRVQNRVISVDRVYSQSELVEASNFFNARFSGE
ncbi:heat-inducible transcriptional repressor HrcA, partial [Pseudomonadota bacterium]